MISVAEAEKIVIDNRCNYGTEVVDVLMAAGRVLAEPIYCDRDLPPFNRVTMDGIAICYESYADGNRTFAVKGIQAAGDQPVIGILANECVEIMTGAALPSWADTVVRYEDVKIADGTATIEIDDVKKGQNIHYRGKDKTAGDIAAAAGQWVTPAVVSIAATVGKTEVLVKKQPKIAIISTGDELVDIYETPTEWQIRRSNSYTIQAVLARYAIEATLLHLPDDGHVIEKEVKNLLQQYDVLILSGAVSMGKFDHLPAALHKLSVVNLFHKVAQRPGKPFWFGKHSSGSLVFAFPGNPVSAFLCLHRYLLPWLYASMGAAPAPVVYAVLGQDVAFPAPLQYFMQVSVTITSDARLIATPVEGNGSGDLVNLLDANAFIELPAGRELFSKGEVYRIWPFTQLT